MKNTICTALSTNDHQLIKSYEEVYTEFAAEWLRRHFTHNWIH